MPKRNEDRLASFSGGDLGVAEDVFLRRILDAKDPRQRAFEVDEMVQRFGVDGLKRMIASLNKNSQAQGRVREGVIRGAAKRDDMLQDRRSANRVDAISQIVDELNSALAEYGGRVELDR